MPSVALCGAGMISGAHGLAARLLGYPIVAVASRTPSTAGRRAAEYGARAVAYDELPAGADIVVVCTPPAQHADHAIAMLRAGAGVVLEKPLCTTLDQADALVATSASFGGRLLYAENLAYAPVLEALLLQLPTIGAVHHLEVRAMTPRPTWGAFLSDEWGGGALFDLGVHPLAVAILAGAPGRVTSVQATLSGGEGHGTDEHAEVTLWFDSGLEARVVASWQAEVPAWDVQAASAEGVLRAELLPDPLLERNGDEVVLPPVTAAVPGIEQYGYLNQLRAFADDLAVGRRPVMDAVFGRLVLDVVCAAYRSAGTGRPEPLPFTGRRDRTPLQLWRSPD